MCWVFCVCGFVFELEVSGAPLCRVRFAHVVLSPPRFARDLEFHSFSVGVECFRFVCPFRAVSCPRLRFCEI